MDWSELFLHTKLNLILITHVQYYFVRVYSILFTALKLIKPKLRHTLFVNKMSMVGTREPLLTVKLENIVQYKLSKRFRKIYSYFLCRKIEPPVIFCSMNHLVMYTCIDKKCKRRVYHRLSNQSAFSEK